MSTYKTGTVSVSNGNAIVTGSGTAWAVALVAGGVFSSAGVSVPILSVDGDTSLTLAYDWPGTTATGAAYAIAMESGEAASVANLNSTLSRILVTLSLAGITPNASGTIAERDALTLAVGDKGFLFLHAELGYDFEFYRWSGSAWEGPFATRGIQGASGLIGIWRGPWLTATAYYVNDAVSQGGSSYICVTAHTSGTFSTDLAASKWQLVAQKGADGTPVETAVHAATSKSTPVDADELALVDSAASWGLKKLTWANLKSTLWTTWGALINAGTAKTTPVDADLFAIADSAASNATKKLTWANLKATLAAYAFTWTAVQTFNANSASLPTPPSNTVIQIGGTDASQARVTFDAFGGLGNFTFRRAQGTAAARSALTSGVTIGGFFAFGAYDSTNYSSSARAGVNFNTTENWTSTNQGASVVITATPAGSATQNSVATFSGNGLDISGYLGLGSPATKTADFTVATTENTLINNKTGSSCVVTLPAAGTFPGRRIRIKNLQTQTVVSASSNVVPLAGGAPGTAILAATAGKWVDLESDGTNWVITAAA